jgi:hypothetical protein
MVPKMVAWLGPRKRSMAMAAISGPREPKVPPNSSTVSASSATLGLRPSSQRSVMPSIETT